MPLATSRATLFQLSVFIGKRGRFRLSARAGLVRDTLACLNRYYDDFTEQILCTIVRLPEHCARAKLHALHMAVLVPTSILVLREQKMRVLSCPSCDHLLYL